MFVDPMTLFILAEFLVVYIIINVFLFYNSRLYKVLVALLKEIRFEKLRRQQEKQKELAALRATNKGLLDKTETLEATVKSAGKTIPEQLEERINVLEKKHPHAQDLLNSVERDESAQWLRLRILELEKELLNGNINEEHWEERVKDAITQLTVTEADEKLAVANRKDSAEDSRYTGQLESDLEESQRLVNDAKIRIRQLEGELEEIKTISTPTDNPLETPARGLYEDEIYRLKCDNFDLHENINKLKLELQQGDPSLGTDDFIGLLESQIANMEQYIKSADIAQGLMEKELSAAQSTIDELENNLRTMGTAPGTVDLSSLKSLSEQHEAESDTLDSIKDTVNRLKAGESVEVVTAEQEAHIARLEQIIRESEQCISILENELSQSSQDIQELEGELKNSKTELLSSKLSNLTETQNQQKDGVDNIKELIEEIRGGGDVDETLAKQEKEIDKLERFLSESDTLIGQLEAEIEDLNQRLESQPVTDTEADSTSRPNSDEDIEEMEELLQQFIRDIQWLMKTINRLEDKNKNLTQEMEMLATQPEPAPEAIENTTTIDIEPDDDFSLDEPFPEETAEPPVMIDVEPGLSDEPHN